MLETQVPRVAYLLLGREYGVWTGARSSPVLVVVRTTQETAGKCWADTAGYWIQEGEDEEAEFLKAAIIQSHDCVYHLRICANLGLMNAIDYWHPPWQLWNALTPKQAGLVWDFLKLSAYPTLTIVLLKKKSTQVQVVYRWEHLKVARGMSIFVGR